MAESTIQPIYLDYVVDLSADNNFIKIPAVQGDSNNARFLRLMLIANNVQYEVGQDADVYIAGKKPDNTNIFNTCSVLEDGRVLCEITAQMTAVEGRGEYQLVITDSSNIQLKSFPFYLVTVKSYDVDGIVSSNEYQAITDAMNKMTNDYEYIIQNIENMQTACEQAVTNAYGYARQAQETIEDMESAIDEAADNLATRVETSAELVQTTTENINDIYEQVQEYAENAQTSATAASTSATNASTSETNAADYATLARQWAIYTDGDQTPSSTNNARYWAYKAKEWAGFDYIDASSITYTKKNGDIVNLGQYISFIEDLEEKAVLVLKQAQQQEGGE